MGSRQQSRFIALMDGYDRTLELTQIAQDSEGQSAAQFLKTLDSMESKLAKVGNSLEQLYQKFVNSDFFGGLLDGLNNLLQGLGKMDAGSLATFATVGVILGNNLIRGLRQSLSGENGIFSAIGQRGSQLSDFLYNKISSKRSKNWNENYVKKQIENTKSNKIKDLNQRIGTSSIELTVDDAKAIEELKELNKQIDQLENKQIELEANPEEVAKLNDEIYALKEKKEALESNLGEGKMQLFDENFGESYNEIIKEAENGLGKLDHAVASRTEMLRKNAANSMKQAGMGMVTAMAAGITTALNSDDPMAGFWVAISSFATVMLPQLFSILAGAVGSGMAGVRAAVDAAGGWITLAIEGIVMAITGVVALITWFVANNKSEAEKLEKELDKLKEKQKELEEASEKSTAEAAIEKTKNKNLEKLVDNYDELIKKTGRTSEENEKLNETIQQLATDFPDLVQYYDEAGNAVLKQRDTWQEIIELQKDATKIALTQALADQITFLENKKQISEKNIEIAKEGFGERLKNILPDVSYSNIKRTDWENQGYNLFNVLNKAYFSGQDATQAQKILLRNLTGTTNNNDFNTIAQNKGFIGKNDFATFELNYVGNQSLIDWIEKSLYLSEEERNKKLKEELSSHLSIKNKGRSAELSQEQTNEIVDEYINTYNDTINQTLNGLKILNNELTDLQKGNNQDQKDIEKITKQEQEKIKQYFIDYIKTFSPKIAENLSQETIDLISKVKTSKVAEEKNKVGTVQDALKNDSNFIEQIENSSLSPTQKQTARVAYSKIKGKNIEDITSEQDLKYLQQVEDSVNLLISEGIDKIIQATDEELNILQKNLGEEKFSIFGNDWNNENLNNIKTILKEIKTMEGISPEFIEGLENEYDRLDEKIHGLRDSTGELIKDEFGNVIEQGLEERYWSIAEKFGYNLGRVLQDKKITDAEMGVLDNVLEKATADQANKLTNLLTNVNFDWGNPEDIKKIANAVYEITENTEETVTVVNELASAFSSISLANVMPERIDSKFQEWGKLINDIKKEYKDLNSAIEEFNENGQLTISTIIDMVEAGNIQYLTYDKNTKAIGINTQAIEDSFKAKIKEKKLTIENAINEAKQLHDGFLLQAQILRKRAEQAKEYAKSKTKITAEQAKAVLGIEQQEAISIEGTQLKLNTAGLQNNEEYFTKLANNTALYFTNLAQLAAAGGQDFINSFLSGIAQGDSISTALSSFSANIVNAQKSLTGNFEGLTDEQIEELVNSNIKEYWTEVGKQLDTQTDDYEALAKAMEPYIDEKEKELGITNSLDDKDISDHYKSAADAAKDANKELKDYVSTLERYYTLQKQIEKLEKDRQKYLNQWKKTGSEEDLSKSISSTKQLIEKSAQLAYVGMEDKKRILPETKQKLSKYFTEDELKNLQYDKTTGLLDLDSFYKTKAYAAATQNNDQGEKIDEILNNAASEIEKAQGWIEDYDNLKLETIDGYKEQLYELENIEKSLDRLENINRALESINKILEEAKSDNEEYYETGGREGISGMQYLHTVAEKITSLTKAMDEYDKNQTDILKELQDKDLSKFVYQNEGDGKLYRNPKMVEEYLNLNSTEDGKKLVETLDDLINKYNDLTDATDDAQKSQKDEAKAMRDFAKSLRKSYSDLITRLANDLATLDQKEIDEVKKKYAMIQEEDDKYLDALQKSIDKQRKLREQANSYDDLEKDEKRLALLERDTSGANAAEIAALKEQIKNARQSLVDTEQDNIINNISEENENRKNKMNEETEFLQNVMDERTYDMQYYLDKARDIVDAAINGDAGAYQQLLDIMHRAEEEFFKGTAETQALFDEELKGEILKAQDWAKEVQSGYGDIATSTRDEIIETAKKLAKSQTGLSEFSNGIDKVRESIELLDGGAPFKNIKQAILDAIKELDEFYDKCKNRKYDIEVPIVYKAVGDVDKLPGGTDNSKNNYGYAIINRADSTIVAYAKNEEEAEQKISNGDYVYGKLNNYAPIGSDFTGEIISKNLKIQQAVKEKVPEQSEELGEVKDKRITSQDLQNDYYVINAEEGEAVLATNDVKEANDYILKKNPANSLNYPYYIIDKEEMLNAISNSTIFKRFAKGGLVNYTGPAWVDGTPANPEAFLSVKDTRNIETFTEMLGEFMTKASATPHLENQNVKYGDTSIEIHMEMGQISDDYDADQLFDKMAQRISEASEGNVTIVK